MDEKRLVPELRFPEFGEEWEEKRLGDISELITKGTTPQTFSEEGVNYVKIECLNGINIIKNRCLFISEKTHNKELKRSILQIDDVLFAIAGATVGKIGVVTKDILPANTNQALAIIRLKNKRSNTFLIPILSSRRMKKYIFQSMSVGAQPNLSLKQINDFRFAAPFESKEQQKIATFLTSVDQRIQLLEKKKVKLEAYKKGVMQQIFSQEVRFKDEKGKDFPNWEKKRLEEVLNYEQPTKYLVADTEYKDEYDIPVLTAGKTFLLGFTNETKGVFRDNLPTIIFDDFTTAFQFVDFPFKAKSSAMKMLIPKTKETNMKFIFEAMKTIKFPLAEHKRYWISEYQKEKISYPCIDEQQKIASFLSSIDESIEQVTQQIEHSKTYKKGLLQKMFV